MKRFPLPAWVLALCCIVAGPALAQGAATATAPAPTAEKKEEVCFEGRKGSTDVVRKDIKPGLPNVKCSPTTGAALWYGDPFHGTVPMGKMPLLDKVTEGLAVVKPRSEKMNLLAQCATACHNGVYPKGFPKDNRPVPIPTMEAMFPDAKDFQHGNGSIWCLDCHHATKRDKLVNHFGDPISFDQPQVLCGKCHGDKLRDWRDGIHGKRIGDFTSTGKKRWFTCTECHNPHNVKDGARNRGFVQIQPEPPPQLPKGMKNAAHEKLHPIPH
jgi:hypothetical protein